MSAERVIPARSVDRQRIESYPYRPNRPVSPLPEVEGTDDTPVNAALTTPEEDAQRLASVDQQVYEKLQQAERDALDIARRGYEEGFASGETEGRQFGESQYRAHIQQLDLQFKEISRSLALNERAAKEEILALALAIGEYLAGRPIPDGAAEAGALLDQVLAAHPFPGEPDPAGPATVTAYLNPKDLEAFGPAGREYPGVALKEDSSLGRGSLRLDTADGVLDATLERRRALLMDLVRQFREQEVL